MHETHAPCKSNTTFFEMFVCNRGLQDLQISSMNSSSYDYNVSSPPSYRDSYNTAVAKNVIVLALGLTINYMNATLIHTFRKHQVRMIFTVFYISIMPCKDQLLLLLEEDSYSFMERLKGSVRKEQPVFVFFVILLLLKMNFILCDFRNNLLICFGCHKLMG